jgi:hypothetical protein
MAAAIRAALRDHTRRQAALRLWWLAPAIGALLLPVWLALQARPDACADTATSVVAPACTQLVSVPRGEPEDMRIADRGAVVAALVDEPATALVDELPAKLPAKPQPRFKLRAALARCKTHPTARLKIEYAPGKAVKINGARPLGDVGRCVEGVLERHPPPHAMTLTP